MAWPRSDFRQIITTMIIGGFFVAYFMNPANETMGGALIAAFAGAWGYWLGSSQGAHENRHAMNQDHARLLDVVASTKTDASP